MHNIGGITEGHKMCAAKILSIPRLQSGRPGYQHQIVISFYHLDTTWRPKQVAWSFPVYNLYLQLWE